MPKRRQDFSRRWRESQITFREKEAGTVAACKARVMQRISRIHRSHSFLKTGDMWQWAGTNQRAKERGSRGKRCGWKEKAQVQLGISNNC